MNIHDEERRAAVLYDDTISYTKHRTIYVCPLMIIFVTDAWHLKVITIMIWPSAQLTSGAEPIMLYHDD